MSCLNMLALITLGTSTLMTMSCSHWVYIWVAQEINLMSFICLLSLGGGSESVIKYFIPQALGSLGLLMGGLTMFADTFYWSYWDFSFLYIFVSILLKLGVAPFHFWLISVASSISWFNFMLLLTWQKVGPMILLMISINLKDNYLILSMGVVGTFVGSLGGFAQSNMKSILAFSSISHMGWMIPLSAFNKSGGVMYLFFYILILLPILMIFYFMNNTSMYSGKNSFNSPVVLIMGFSLMSLGGMPPFSGFLLKWVALLVMIPKTPLMCLFMIFMTLGNLYYYLMLTFSMVTFSINSSLDSHLSNLEMKVSSLSLSLLFLNNMILMLLF